MSLLESLYMFMGRRPGAFVILPVLLWTLLVLVGFLSTSDIIENDVSNIWTATSGPFYDNKQYLERVGRDSDGRDSITTFAGTALSRDGGNLLTSGRLEEIEARMRIVDAVVVSYKNRTFDQQDLCYNNGVGLGTTYKFACFRMTAMDLFSESRWMLDETARLTWYEDLVYPQLVEPRLKRFGIMRDRCVDQERWDDHPRILCHHEYRLRMDQDYASSEGYDRDEANPLLLFNDVGGLEMNNRCRMCIEDELVSTMTQMTKDYRILLQRLVNRYVAEPPWFVANYVRPSHLRWNGSWFGG